MDKFQFRNKMNKYFITIFLVFFSYGVYAMGVKQCLFSEMTGVINFEGKPAAGVKLVRMVDYDKPQYDETVTDENGYFHFPAIHRSSLLNNILPMEFAVGQQIIVYKDGKEYEMWSGIKRKPEENSEARGKSLIVECELTLPEQPYIKIDGSPISSLCKWDVEPDQNQASYLFGED